MTTAGEPPVWGSVDLPLLPPPLASWLQKKGIVLPASALPDKKAALNPLAAQLCAPGWRIVSGRNGAIDVAMGVLDSGQRTSDDFLQAIDVPMLECRVRSANELPHLPLLVGTWAAIDEAGLAPADLSYLLSTATLREAVEYIGQLEAVFDLAITAPSWIDGQGRVVGASIPKSLEEAFDLARQRHLAQGGADTPHRRDPRWVELLGRRSGLTESDAAPTLQHCGNALGLTAERVRQVETRCGSLHTVCRRWDLGKLLEELRLVIEKLEGQSLPNTQAELDAQLGSHVPIGRLARLLEEYGHTLAVSAHAGRLRSSDTYRPNQLPTKAQIYAVARSLTDESGFLREGDLKTGLALRYPEAPHDLLDEVLLTSRVKLGLPLGYAFAAGNDATVFGVATRMLAWNNPLNIRVIRNGIDRRFRMRGITTPPPEVVLLELFDQHPSFRRDGDVIGLSEPVDPDTSTIQGWIAQTIRESGPGVLHRVVIIDRGVAAGRKVSSLVVYLTFSELLTPLGSGCFSVAGDVVTPEARSAAIEMANLVRLPTEVRYRSTDSGVEIRVVVGHQLLATGVLALRRQTAVRLGAGRLKASIDGETRGHLALSNETNLYGLMPALTALSIEAGDEMTITVHFPSGVAEIRRTEAVGV